MEEDWFNKRRREDWDNLPFIIRESVIDSLSKNFQLDFSVKIQKQINEDENWWKEYPEWGVELRTYLKQMFKDSELPKNNWEYYWVCAIEKSVERVIEENEKSTNA